MRINEKEQLFWNLPAYLYLNRFIVPVSEEVKEETEPKETKEDRKEINLLLHGIYENPTLTSVKLYKKIGFSLGLGHKMKNELIKQGLIQEINVVIKPGRGGIGKVLCLTDKAYELINLPKPNLGKGGHIHRFWMLVIKKHFEAQGIKVEIEHPIGTAGKSIDLMAGNTAIEICIHKSNLKETAEKLLSIKAERMMLFQTEKEAKSHVYEGISSKPLYDFYED